MDRVARVLAEVPPPGPISLRLGGHGRFGPVLWAGVHGETERLTAFREDVRLALADAGYPIDPRPFQPHLTVAYQFDRRLATRLDAYGGPSWPADELALMESRDGDYLTVWTRPLSR